MSFFSHVSSNKVNQIESSLSSNTQVAVNFADFNPDATGVADSTTAFINAVNKANSITKVTALPVGISIPPGTYIINKTSDLSIPSLICSGGVAKLIIQDTHAFVINSNFCLSNIQVVSTVSQANTDSSYNPLFKATTTVSNITFNNVLFDSQLTAGDGSVRASAAIDLKIVNHLTLNKVVMKGYRRGFTSTGISTDIKGDMLHFENVELPIYISGSDPNVTDTNYAYNIQFTNVSHINTATQALNYFKKAGADTFLFEKCDTVTISNVTTEYAVERASYCSSCKNVVYSHWQIKNCEGVKFVGNVRNDTGLNNVADTWRISNIHVNTNITDSYLACFYFAKNITIKNCTINGQNAATSAISTMHYIENVTIENVYAENLKRGFFEFTYYGTIAGVGSIPANPDGNYPAGINGLTTKGITVKNSHTIAFPVYKIQDISGTVLPAGTYRHQNIIIKDNDINNNQADIYGTVTGQLCQGLININDAKNIRCYNNKVYGYAVNDANSNQITVPYQIGSNTYNVQIHHKEIVRNRDHQYFWGTLFVSGGSEFEMITARYNDSYENRAVISLKNDPADPLKTKDISQNFTAKGTIYLHNITDTTLPLIGYGVTGYTIPSLFGLVEVIGGTDSGTGRFVIKQDGSTTLLSGSSTLYATAVTSGKFAIFKDGTYPRYTLRYMAGSAMGFIVNYTLTAA